MAKDFKPTAHTKAIVDGWSADAAHPPKRWQHIVLYDTAHDMPGAPANGGMLVVPNTLSPQDRAYLQQEWKSLQFVQASDFKAPHSTHDPFGPDVATLVLSFNPSLAPSFALGVETPAPKPNIKHSTVARHHMYNSTVLFDNISHFIQEMHLEPMRVALYRTPGRTPDDQRTAIITLTTPETHAGYLQQLQSYIGTARIANIAPSSQGRA